MIYRNYIIFLYFVSIVSGCAVPGGHIQIDDKEILGQQDEDLSDLVDVQAITVDLLKYLKKTNTSTANPQTNSKLLKELDEYRYRIGKGDVLNITVWDHPELTIPAGQFRSSSETGNWVNHKGNIFYPYIGEVYVEGKTLEEVRTEITHRLSKYVEKPQVDINIAAFRSHKVFITGEVNKPGNIPITNIPLTLLDAINQAGGLTEKADWQRVILHRNGENELLSLQKMLQYGEMTQNRLMQPGDIAHVGSIEDRKVFVMGSVKNAGTLSIGRNGLNLTEAISNAGGLNEAEADATGVFVIRSVSNLDNLDVKKSLQTKQKIARVYQLNLADATAMVLGVEFPLRQNDVLYVTTAPVSRWARVINQLFPTILSIGVIDNLSGSN